MRENVASVLKQRRLGTPGGTTDFHIQQWRRYSISTCTSSRDNYKVSVWLTTGVPRHSKLCKFEIICYSVTCTCLSTLVNRTIFNYCIGRRMRRNCIRIFDPPDILTSG